MTRRARKKIAKTRSAAGGRARRRTRKTGAAKQKKLRRGKRTQERDVTKAGIKPRAAKRVAAKATVAAKKKPGKIAGQLRDIPGRAGPARARRVPSPPNMAIAAAFTSAAPPEGAENALHGAAAAALMLAPPEPEKRLREDPDFTKKFEKRPAALQSLVPLSRAFHPGLWALDLVDAFAARSDAARAPAGETHIVARTEGEAEPELATRRNGSGFTVVRSVRVTEYPAEGHPVTSIRPVRAEDGKPVREAVVSLHITNKGYDTRTIAKDALQAGVVLDGSMVPSINDPEGGNDKKDVWLLGRAPTRRKQFVPRPGAEVRITEPASARQKTHLDGNGRFVFTPKAAALFPANAPEAQLQLEIDERAKKNEQDDVLKVVLTYRVTRQDSTDETGAQAGANHTTRTKLIEKLLPPDPPPPAEDETKISPLEAKDIPPIHLLLLPEPA